MELKRAIPLKLLSLFALAAFTTHCSPPTLISKTTSQLQASVTRSSSSTSYVATMVSAGVSHTCAVVNSAAYCWGRNVAGQLGNSTTTDSVINVGVTGLTSNVTAIAAGTDHSCAVVNGGVYCWGDNTDGELGDATNTASLFPVAVSGIPQGTGATDVSVGHNFSCALVNGGIKCWGANASGQLGDSTNVANNTPQDVTGLLAGVSSISVGYDHACAVVAAGAKCWGDGTNGQVGDGTAGDFNSAQDVSGLAAASGVTQISAGSNQTCAVVSAGAKCWGLNTTGGLGDSSVIQRNTPVDVTGLLAGVSAVTAGNDLGCALLTTGALQCWGLNSSGQVGDGTNTNRNAPVGVFGLTSGAGTLGRFGGQGAHNCIITTAGRMKCWGGNTFGQVGDSTTVNWTIPVSVYGF